MVQADRIILDTSDIVVPICVLLAVLVILFTADHFITRHYNRRKKP